MKNILFTTHLDDNFIDGALVMLYSMKKNVKDFMQYPVKIMHSTTIAGISEDNQEKIRKIVPHVEFLSLECFKSTTYEKLFFFDCDMLCVNDITEGIENSPATMVSGCGGSSTNINCGLMVIGKEWLNDNVYNQLLDYVRTGGVTRLFTQHMINKAVPEFNLLPDSYNWKVAPHTDPDRVIHEYGITDETKIIHWAGALPDTTKNRKPFPKPWEEAEDANPVTQLWYKYKKEMLKELI